MPKKLHDKLVREAKKKGLTGEAFDRYVFGTLSRIEKDQKRKRSRRSTGGRGKKRRKRK